MEKILNNLKLRKKNFTSYDSINQSDPDGTRDEYLESQYKLEKKKEKYLKSNLFKSRIINTEINSSLILQIVLYYNFFYSIMCFLIQFFSACFKV